MKWISIEKQLPPFDLPILVFDEVDLVCVAFYQRFGLEFRSVLFTDYELEYVTHWQPCPRYPADDESGPQVRYFTCCEDQGGHAKDETCDMWRAHQTENPE